MYTLDRITGILSLAGLCVAGWWSARLALPDRPGSAEDVAERATAADYAGQDAEPLFRRVTELNPRHPAAWIRLGLRAELRGELATAESLLLRAARFDRQHEARWTLANFYFRRGDAANFWQWARWALEISYGDRRPLFDLCWRMSGDAEEILRRAIPENREVVGAYLYYLLEEKRVAAIPAVARKLAPEDRELRWSAIDTLIAAGDAAAARELAGATPGITNGDFRRAPTAHGFDWRPLPLSGLSVIHLPDRGALRLTLNGKQPEQCELLAQYVLLEPGRKYRLGWEAAAPAGGLSWEIADESAPLEPSESWRAGSLTLRAQSEMARLVLRYRRPLGSARLEGSVELRRITLEPL